MSMGREHGQRQDSPERGLLPRPHVTEAVAAGVQHRLLLMVAGAGFGKTCALSEWAETAAPAWITVRRRDRGLGGMARALAAALDRPMPGIAAHLDPVIAAWRPETDTATSASGLADLFAEALEERGDPDLTLVVDDADEIGTGDHAWRLLESLVRQAPSGLHIVVSARTPPPLAVERLRGRGAVAELGADDLRFDLEMIQRLLAVHGVAHNRDLGEQLLRITGGRAAAVRLAAQALGRATPRHRVAILERLTDPGRPLGEYLAAEVLDAEGEEARRLVVRAVAAGYIDTTLAEAAGAARPGEVLIDLVRRGVATEDPPGSGRYTVGPALAAVVRRSLGDDELEGHRRTAVEALEEAGRTVEAIATLMEGRPTRRRNADLRAVLRRAGLGAVNPESAALIAAACTAVGAAGSERAEEDSLDRMHAEALRMSGDWDGALAILARTAPATGPCDAGLAWRWGFILYQRGEPAEALEVLRRAALGEGDPADGAQVLALIASILWSRGRVDDARTSAADALVAARRAGDASAIAAAHTALALVAASEGDRDRNHREYLAALAAAERGADVVQQARIHANLSSKWLEEGRAAEAIAEADAALRLGRGIPAFAALAESNRAEALMRLGRLDEARSGLEAGRLAYAKIGSLLVEVPLRMLADLHRERGDLVQARAHYEEARALSEKVDDVHDIVQATCGLARVIAAGEPDEAQRLVDDALARADALTAPGARCAAGWVALSRGDIEVGRRHAAEALLAARAVADDAALAEALELDAASGGPALARLDEAISVWHRLGNPIGEARAQLAQALMVEPASHVAQAAQARAALAGLGVREEPAAAGLLAVLARRRPGVRVTTLGAFTVVRDGRPVTPSAWQSRKSRDLLKLLIAARGRAVTRERAAETLWPEEPADRLSNRLSVALSLLRGALDPDRAHTSDHFVRGDRRSLNLDLHHVEVDVVRLLDNARHGRRAVAAEDWETALPLLRAVEDAYSGDFLEEDAYEEWTAECREAVRAAVTDASRTLAGRALATGDLVGAALHLRRQLERDPYDEDASLALVRALVDMRRHGEARRVYSAYRACMTELGVEPESFPTMARAAS